MDNPYIGITDFTGFPQVESMLRVFKANLGLDSQRKLHVGVMMSYKTLNDIETKWSRVFPPKEGIADIFRQIDNESCYYCLHYADYSQSTEYTDLSRAINYAGPYADAIQLDMPWPDPAMIGLGVFGSNRRQIEVILQIGKNAIEAVENNPKAVVERLKLYEGVVDRVLLDKSMGRGMPMDAKGLIPFAEAIAKAFPSLGIGVAGGLGPDTIGLIKPIAALFTDLSIDAQGRLRPSGNAMDPIDWTMAENYLIKALKLLS